MMVESWEKMPDGANCYLSERDRKRHNLEMLFSAKTYLVYLSTLITIDESKLEDKEDSG